MTTTTTMKKGIGLHCWWQDVSQRRRKPSLLGAGGGGDGTCFERWTESFFRSFTEALLLEYGEW